MPNLYSNIPLLWEFLDLVVDDWNRTAEPYQNKINKSKSEKEKYYFLAKAFADLQPYFLKCLFSYVFFFVAIDKAYELLFRELNNLNKEVVFKVKHEKQPKKNDYIKKVILIRNNSIAHLGSNEKLKGLDLKAAMSWQPMTLSGSIKDICNINNMSFGSMKWRRKNNSGGIEKEQSIDLEIKGIHEIDEYCIEYLVKFDKVCASYLENLISKLPAETESKAFSLFK
jgi:hypothetical protein